MIKTQRISHINDIPALGYVKCPSCHSEVNISDKYCPCCKQIVNYSFNRQALLNWNLDLYNFRIIYNSHGVVSYTNKWIGEHYHNYYSIKDGRNMLPDTYSLYDLKYSHNGYFIIRGPRGGQYGVLDKEGNTIISPVCDYIDDVDDFGHFVVKYKGKTGVNDILNHNIIPFEYDSIKRASFLNKYFFIVGRNDKYGLIDQSNRIIVPIEFDAIGEYRGDGYIPICSNNRWGFYDPDKNLIAIPLKFDKVEPYKGDSAKVSLGDIILYIDKEGFPTLPNKQVIENGKVVIRNSEGRLIPGMVFDPIQLERELSYFEVNGKKGAIYPDGSFAISPLYDELYLNYENGDLHAAKKGEKWGVINTKGEIIIPFKYNQTLVDEGLIRIEGFKDPNGGWQPYTYGYIDRWGETVIPQDYLDLGGFEEGLCLYGYGKGMQGIMDKFGNYVEYRPVVINGKYQDL